MTQAKTVFEDLIASSFFVGRQKERGTERKVAHVDIGVSRGADKSSSPTVGAS